MFSNMISMFKNKEIRNKVLFTLAMLFVFRFGAAITVPGVNTAALEAGLQDNSFLSMLNMLGGGGIEQFSIFALGVGPYITASIIIQLLSMDVIPALSELAKSGASGRKKMDRYTRYLAVVLGFVQAYTMMLSFSFSNTSIFTSATVSTYLYIATLLVAGSMFLLWIGDRISARGIGNGISMIIFAGIVAKLPTQFVTTFKDLVGTGAGSAVFNGILMFSLYLLCYLCIVVLVILMQTAERKIPIQYTSSTIQTRKKDMTYLPLKINSASVIPVIFSSAVMVAPITIAGFFAENDFIRVLKNVLGFQTWYSLLLYVVLIIAFTFFYTKLQVDPEQIAENLGKSGTYIPGIRPGTETKQYLNKVLNRITVLGSVCLAFIAVLPYALPMFTNLPKSMGLGGTGIIIVVGVAMETVKQMQGQMTQKSYRGFIRR